jgi:hypothetical protein
MGFVTEAYYCLQYLESIPGHVHFLMCIIGKFDLPIIIHLRFLQPLCAREAIKMKTSYLEASRLGKVANVLDENRVSRKTNVI